MAKFSSRSRAALKGAHPNLVRLMEAAIIDTPYDFTITDGVRTTAAQQALYAQGRTAPGDVVTYADGVNNKSNHQAKADGYGHAVDLYPYVDGKVDFNNWSRRLSAIAAHIKATAVQLGTPIKWGGDFPATKTMPKGWDKPHFELI